MIVFRHRKTGEAGYLSHIDTMRVLQRAMRRMDAKVKFSGGFVPHMITYTTTPLPLGVQSLAEYFVADSPLTGEEQLLEKFNASVPTGLAADFCAVVDKNPNLAAQVVASEYIVTAQENASKEICDILKETQYFMTQNRKGELVTLEVRSKIFDVDVCGNQVKLLVATGNSNLRIDAFVNSLVERYGLKAGANDILRTEQFVRQGSQYVAAKEILK